MANEKRLIDANALIHTLDQRDKKNSAYNLVMSVIIGVIDRQPTVDAVEVVRCKDCKHYHRYHQGKTNELCEWGKCNLINMDVDMPSSGFCCYGERKDNETL